ncbi:hypothetical protein FDH01_gp043 [Acinetobacter phage vB_AbaM_ME3]|uniref:Uncharacterized protein n=1 Tax=Acinetobacter phage vB_AbaM_ME3 TaxID=1837876 RepID=A0A172Q031_9CAUD|nr:hypothetical protein FDH01_gp043 [Acinetobacter phage vB_AbaM_ME3]AND75204.1 hypothetical protein ME3_43 [Acinetobacter phage vB_AbaM_ME3]
MLQSKTTQIYSEINTSNIGYQYDSRDKEIFLEEGYKYSIVTTINGVLIRTDIDLTEVNNDN